MSKETEPNKSAPCVWVSRAMMDSSLIVGFRSELSDTDLHRSIELGRKVQRGRALPTDVFPSKFYDVSKKGRPKSLPDFLMCTLYLVSDRLMDALRTADLGSTSFHSVELYERDRTQRIDAPYSIIAFGETKSTVLPERSARIRHMPGPRPVIPYGLQLVPQDGDLTLSEDALLGPDLWIEENVIDAFFLSERLVQTLEARNLARQLSLYRCRIEPANHA
jgi:hypothetical protein